MSLAAGAKRKSLREQHDGLHAGFAVFRYLQIFRRIGPGMIGGLVGKRPQHQFVAIPIAFHDARAFIRRQQPPAEFSEHLEKSGLLAIICGAIRHLELCDHIDSHGGFQFCSGPRLLLQGRSMSERLDELEAEQ